MVGGRAYIASLSSMTPTTSNAMEYGRIVAEKASVRRLIETADDIVTKGYDGTMDANQMLDYAESGIFEISQARQKGQYSHIRDVLVENLAIIDRAEQMDGGLTGITTGFSGRRNDVRYAEIRPDHPGSKTCMGKTAFALSLARNAAVKGKASVMIFFGLKWLRSSSPRDFFSMESKVDLQTLKTGRLERRDWDDSMWR